ncbi:hypothetical protein [Acidovorax sp. Leaf78]|uniref:hypothetical protein n=1 Tax=Acidovorax sp. Leaf78 TaxID=1736237 RepID=UPI000ABEF428|nr:hypothetical protein [Acidovorax sp. Leaf78]
MEHQMSQSIEGMERHLKLRQGFFKDLLADDDWSFVIKLSSLFEAACTQALVKRLGKPELEEELGWLDMANHRFGKVRLLESLGAITKGQYDTLTELATLRNTFVHQVGHVNSTISEYLQSLSIQRRNEIIKKFTPPVQGDIVIGGHKIEIKTFVNDNIKLAIWLACYDILACLHLDFTYSELEHITNSYQRINEHLKSLSVSFKSNIGKIK